MKYLAIGIVLAAVGLGLLIVSLIPINIPTRMPITVSSWGVWLDEEFEVPPGKAKAFCSSFLEGTRLTIHIHVLSGGDHAIRFWVMDEDQWDRFQNGEDYRYYTEPSRKVVSEAVITWSPPPNKRICFVYDNTLSINTSKWIHTEIDYEQHMPTYVKVTETYTLSYLSIPGILMLVVGIGLIIKEIVNRRRARSV